MLQSAEYWVGQMGVDGLRVDAIHAIKDDGARHVLAELVERVHAANPKAAVIAESALNDPKVIRPEGGYGCDAQWADDFHHCLRTVLTGEREGYYSEFGSIAQLAKAFHRPFVFDGTYSPHRRRRYGAPADDRPPSQFVVFTQNHDHVGNRALGDRLPRSRSAARRVLRPTVSVRADALPGRGIRRDRPVPVLQRPHRRRRSPRRPATAACASSPSSRPSPGQVPDPQDPATFERSKLSRDGAARASASCTRA